MYNVQYLPLIKLRNQLIIEVEGKWCRTVFTLHAQAAFAALTMYGVLIEFNWCFLASYVSD